jgi:ubiquinone/menaquinone biosynthesis C-methylase UbiE
VSGAVDYRRFTGNAAENYQRDFVPAIGLPVSAELLRAADLQAGERVLDVACGTGVITRQAAVQVGPSGSVTGVDITPEMLAVASAQPVPAGAAPVAPIEWRQGDATTLPLPDERYDVVLSQLGLMFMADRAAAAAEMRRVLVPGGRLVLSTAGRIQPVFEIMDRAIARHVDADLAGFVQSVFSLHDPEVVATLFRSAGFDGVTSRVYEVPLLLPAPTEFLWQYLNLTPIAPLVAQAPEPARVALEADFVDAVTPAHTHPDGTTAVTQPMTLTTAHR